jgi:hypothetical protein
MRGQNERLLSHVEATQGGEFVNPVNRKLSGREVPWNEEGTVHGGVVRNGGRVCEGLEGGMKDRRARDVVGGAATDIDGLVLLE